MRRGRLDNNKKNECAGEAQTAGRGLAGPAGNVRAAAAWFALALATKPHGQREDAGAFTRRRALTRRHRTRTYTLGSANTHTHTQDKPPKKTHP